MAAGTTIRHKRKAGPFSGGELAAGEFGVDVTNSKVYSSIDGTTVFVVDTGISELVEDTTPTLGGNLDADSNRITNLGAPVAGTDATNKNYVDAAVRGLSFDKPVEAIQTDNTLDPGGTPTTGDRYIIENSASLHANFGTITGIGDDDIVEYDGSDFVVVFDASAEGEGESVYNKGTNTQYVFSGSAWVILGGASDHGSLTGLSDDDHTQYALITTSAGAPGSTPARRGAVHVDTSSGRPYIATGTSSAADWQILVEPDTTDTLTNKTISSSTNTIDGGTL